MSVKILLTEEISRAGVEALEKAARIVWAADPGVEAALALAADVDGIISRNTVIDERVFSIAPKLKVVATHGVGYDHVDVKAATAHGVCVVNTPGANARSVAELALGFMLALGRKMAYADAALRTRRDFYARNRCTGQDLCQKTLLVVGMGAIGSTLSQICVNGFSMRVLGYDPHVSGERMAKLGVQKAGTLEGALPEADYVSLHCPFSDGLYHMIDAKRLELMKPTAFLINCSRGKLVDEQALCEALRTGVIAGAGLDVFDPEPPAADNPLFLLDNIITTPHIGYNATDSFNRMSLWSVEDVMHVLDGHPEKARVVNREAYQ